MIKKVLSRLIAAMPDQFRHYYYYRMLGSISFPEIVHIENTNACNAECIMCARDTMKRGIGFMDFDLFKKIIDECSSNEELKEVHLHGFGEPLMDKRFIDRVRYAKQNKIKKVYFVTNASLLTREYSKALLETDIDVIKFSVYGNSPETYEAIHRGLKYRTVEENILRFFDMRRRTNRAKPSIKIQFLPQDINIHERSAFFNKWSPLIDKKSEDAIEEFRIHNWIYGKRYHNISSIKCAKKSCGIPFVSIQILWNGDVTACCYDYDGKMKFGNVEDMMISDIWNGVEFCEFRNLHRKSKFEKLNMCNICDQLR